MAEARPRIGVTRWAPIAGERQEDYCDRVREAGGEPVVLTEGVTDADGLDGLILSGGIDVDPERYGEARHPKVRYFDPARDAFEAPLLLSALAADLPVLAICRGQQLLNVALGGRLIQHLEDEGHWADYRQEGAPSGWHPVRLAAGSRLRALLGADEIEVNSRHHQAIAEDGVAPGLRVAAMSPSGLIEGVESASHRWVIGVQWHPERVEPNRPEFAQASRPLFEALVRESGKVAGRA